MANFILPKFKDNKMLEIRQQDNEIIIYGNSKGLQKLSALLLDLANSKVNDHIHLEDYEILNEKSVPVVIAVFNTDQ